MISQVLFPVIITMLAYVVIYAIQFVYRDISSPLRGMPGPKNPSFIVGNFKQMMDDAFVVDGWRRAYGPNFQFKGLFNLRELHTSDVKAISHIISHSTIYRKAHFNLRVVKQLFGDGLLSSELDSHKRQRRIMNPAFSAAQIRRMSDIFVEQAAQLRDVWDAHIEGDSTTIEALSWLRRSTLDAIGQAGFNHQFNSLKEEPDDLSCVLTKLFHSPNSQRNGALRVAQAMIPILRLIRMPGTTQLFATREKMFSISRELVNQCKSLTEKGSPSSGSDLLSILVAANMSADIPEHQRLTEDEVISQIPTFFIAGHETTSSAISWALHALSLNQTVQSRLRNELLAIPTDTPTAEQLNSCEYLEWVIRENLRVHSPVTFVSRMAMEEDALPLGRPYTDQAGIQHNTLPIRKGQMIHIPILAINTDPDIWGLDAAEFRPERWAQVPDAANAVPGIYSNLLTFFAGPHNCIGFRFTLAEQKAVLFTLIRAFVFENAVPKGGICRSSNPLTKPVLAGDKTMTGQLPLILRRYQGA